MIKENIFNDERFRELLIMCFYRCNHAMITFDIDSYMADYTMKNANGNMNVSPQQEVVINDDTDFNY